MSWKAQYKMLLKEGKETMEQQFVEFESTKQEIIQQSNEKMDRALEKAVVSMSSLFQCLFINIILCNLLFLFFFRIIGRGMVNK